MRPMQGRAQASTPAANPWLQPPTTSLCLACGRGLGRRYIALATAPWPTWVHVACSPRLARRLLDAWRRHLAAAEFELP
jgi:hypothetical protein